MCGSADWPMARGNSKLAEFLAAPFFRAAAPSCRPGGPRSLSQPLCHIGTLGAIPRPRSKRPPPFSSPAFRAWLTIAGFRVRLQVIRQLHVHVHADSFVHSGTALEMPAVLRQSPPGLVWSLDFPRSFIHASRLIRPRSLLEIQARTLLLLATGLCQTRIPR